jgi:YD repeat-containing protein
LLTDSISKTTTYTYDEVGNPVNITYPNNVQAVYSFDALHRLTQLTNQNHLTQAKFSEFTYTYDPAGRRSRIESLEGVTDYSYDSLGELTSEIKSLDGANLYQAAYEYDPSGNRTRMLKEGTEHIYSYNSLNQLTQEGLTGPAAMPITVTGTVSDANGIQALTVNGSNATIDGNTFTTQINLTPGENTLTVIATDKANNTATKSLKVTYVQTDQILYVYDNNGNLIHKQSTTQELSLSYDYENRLTRVIASPAQQGEAIYAYDGEGKRVSSTANSTTTNYLYDGLDILLGSVMSAELSPRVRVQDTLEECAKYRRLYV